MSEYCFGIYLIKNSNEQLITDLSIFNYFIKNYIIEFMIASAKEIIDRTKNYCIIDIELKLYKKLYLVGIKTIDTSCFIFTTENKSHIHLFILAKYIMRMGLLDSIKNIFNNNLKDQNRTEILKEICSIKYDLVENINSLLDTNENFNDIVEKSKYLSIESKKYFFHRRKYINL